jgi:hypothetical protein
MQMGFGNTITLFRAEMYPQGMKQFIDIAQKSIKVAVEAKTGRTFNVIVLNIQGVDFPNFDREMFLSYNSVSIQDGKVSFGNLQMKFDSKKYNNNNSEVWLLDTQKSIANQIYKKTGRQVAIQLAFFK